MNSIAYPLPVLDKVLDHGWRKPQTFHDINVHDKDELFAQIASKDYFATLATTLDQVSQDLEAKHHNDFVILEKLVNDLLYLQANYEIIRK